MNKLIRCILCSALSCAAMQVAHAQGPDPFAGNNTVYPPAAEWEGKQFRTSNYDYPIRPIVSGWLRARPAIPALTKSNAPAYIDAVKKFIEKDMSGLLNDPMHWTPNKAGWYDMPWGGQGSMMSNGKVDPSSGREALLGSYTGQILESASYPANQRPTV